MTRIFKRQHYFIILLIVLSSVFSAKAQITLKMQKESGVYTIPCSVNGKPLKFIFDTGASDVLLSLSEAGDLFNKGLISRDDFFGIEYYQDATGRISEGIKVNIRSLKIGSITITNVEASISNNISAPLLLGNSALSKIGKVIFDPMNSTLTILNKTIIEKGKVYDMFSDILYNYSGLIDNFCGFRLLQYEDCIINEFGESDLMKKIDDDSKYVVYNLNANKNNASLIFTLRKLSYGANMKQISSIQLTGINSDYSVRGITLGSPLSLLEGNFGTNYTITPVQNYYGTAELIQFNDYNISFEINNDVVRSIKVFYKNDSLMNYDQVTNFKFLKNALSHLDTESIVYLFAPDFEIACDECEDYIRFERGIIKDKKENKKMKAFIENTKYGLKSLLNLTSQPTYVLRVTEKAGLLIVLSFKQQKGIREVVFKPYLNKYLIWEIN